MLDAGNPYVLPAVIVGAVVYLGVTILTDASVLVRVGILVGIAGVVPIVLNRILGRGAETPASAEAETTGNADSETAESDGRGAAESDGRGAAENDGRGTTAGAEREAGDAETEDGAPGKPAGDGIDGTPTDGSGDRNAN